MMKGTKASNHNCCVVAACGHKGVRGGFTLIELLLAVVVLLAVILATSRIFSTASQVTGIGHAAASVLQESSVIEQRMREDIKKLSRDGVFLIRQVAVPNDLFGEDDLLNPLLPPETVIRADQLLFFREGLEAMTTVGLSAGERVWAQSMASRVYYGHAFQLPDGVAFLPGPREAHDPANNIFPWHRGNVQMVETSITTTGAAGGGTGTAVFRRRNPSATPQTIDGTQPDPRQWLLTRQHVLLINDTWNPPNSNSRTVVFNDNRTARSIFNDWGLNQGTIGEMHPVFGWSREIRNGRFDAAASTLGEIRRYIEHATVGLPGTLNGRWWGDPRPWKSTDPSVRTQRDVLGSELLFYPRAERIAPSMHRVDQALTNHVIGGAVSSIIIEWTWDDGTGEVYDENGALFYPVPVGFYTNAHDGGEDEPVQPWFGLNRHPDYCNFCEDRGVGLYSDIDPTNNDSYRVRKNYRPAWTVYPNDDWPADIFDQNRWTIEDVYQIENADWDREVMVYEAFFGYNQGRPPRLRVDITGALVPIITQDEDPNDIGYTPWPSAIRVTLIMHDPQGRLEHGREVQFTIDLPRKNK